MAANSNLGNTNQMMIEPPTATNAAKIAELEIANFVARQEVEKWRRDYSALEERAARLEKDCSILREREAKDRETIKSLIEEIEKKEEVFREKFVKVIELGRRCEELEGEISGVKVNEERVLEEMPKRGKESRAVTPKQKRSRELVVADNGSEGKSDDGVLLRQLKKKRVMEVNEESDRGDESEEACEGDTEVDEVQIPSMPLHDMEEEEFGITRKPKGLLEVAESEYKILTRNRSPTSKRKFKSSIARCSSTAGNSVISDYDRVDAGQGSRSFPKRNSRERGYMGRIASQEENYHAVMKAEELQRILNSNHPSFIKSVMRSHVSTSFWIGFPPKFCEENLPTRGQVRVVLEDEKGLEQYANYIGSRGGLRGGWRRFATAHNLEVGDALLFELTEPTRFKVYIIKANQESTGDLDGKIAEGEGDTHVIAEDEGDTPIIHHEEEGTSKAKTPNIRNAEEGIRIAKTPITCNEEEGTSRPKRRGRPPLRFRFVRSNIPKLEMQSKPEGHV